MAQRVKHLPSMQETWVWSLGGEDPLEKEMETHSSILPGKPHKELDTTEWLHFNGIKHKTLKCSENSFKSKRQKYTDRISQVCKSHAQKAENTIHTTRVGPAWTRRVFSFPYFSVFFKFFYNELAFVIFFLSKKVAHNRQTLVRASNPEQTQKEIGRNPHLIKWSTPDKHTQENRPGPEGTSDPPRGFINYWVDTSNLYSQRFF